MPGTLYPVLHHMAESGYLTRQDRLVNGKVPKYYAITDAGRRTLEEARARIGELVHEVLEDHGPSPLPDPAESVAETGHE